jgi:acetolactate decarboxylase
MRYINYLLIVTACACSSQSEQPMVNSIGELRQIMHQGKFEARVGLDTLAKTNVYGLGAMDSLAGEILILDGNVFQSSGKDDSLFVSTDSKTKATLLVYAEISAWDTLNIANATDMETELSKVANLLKPFPFILIGKPSIDYHIINFDAKNGDFNKHKEGAFTGSIDNEDLTVLGFYSTDAKGIYTHHDSNLHMHMINENRTIMGHVDRIDINGKDLKLLLPKEL